MADLAAWLNADYLDRLLLHSVAKAYQGNPSLPSVQLRGFLDKGRLRKLRQDALRAERRLISVPDMHVYETLLPRGEMLAFGHLIRSREFGTLVSFIAGEKVSCRRVEWRSFGHRHYTLLHDKLKQEPGIYLFFDLASWDESWGGHTSFVREGEELARVVPMENAVTFLSLGKARQFTKYVNHRAGRVRRVVLMARFK